jgi:hypothetical protein
MKLDFNVLTNLLYGGGVAYLIKVIREHPVAIYYKNITYFTVSRNANNQPIFYRYDMI